MTGPKPLIGVPADYQTIEGHGTHTAGDKYLRAVFETADALPVILPAFGAQYDLEDLLARLDGVLFTGAVSNVEPRHYGGDATADQPPYDPLRDATTLPLIPTTIRAGVPLLCICRGHQELNVALGGTLHPRVHELPGRLDHRARKELPIPEMYAPVHTARLAEGGLFRELAGGAAEIEVNSLHWQAIDRLAERLVVEATAPDGTIEAVRVGDAATFAIGVQWHPEWRASENAFSRALFHRFGEAARARAAIRRRQRAA